MKFIKDILLFDISTTGQDVDKDNIIQLSGILLKKDNLLEADFFNTYIRVSYLDSFLLEHSKMLGIDYETLRKSYKIYEAIKKFRSHFGNKLLLATHSMQNVLFLKAGFRKAVVAFDYDSHILDLWTLGYVYTLNYGLKKMPSFHTFADYFKLKQKNPSDSLERVRLQAEIFRKIIKEV
jgi:DNA polymerase III alpha subunit (gram-positive type)